MSSRKRILDRLREAGRARQLNAPEMPPDSALFTDYPRKQGQRFSLFSEKLQALSGEVFFVEDERQAASELLRLLRSSEKGPWLAQQSALIDSVVACEEELRKKVQLSDDISMPSTEMAAFAAGISEADCLVARTGSIVLRSSTAGGRRLSVLPPLHIVIARESQLVDSLEQALDGIDDRGEWSYASVITGPSRTSDIEKTLVLGAHGPKRLAVIVIRGL